MNFKSLLYFFVALTVMTSVGCNSSGDYYSIEDDSGIYAAYINSFSLAEDTSVLANLDTVFFTIDLDGCRVFNADSLPKGTNVSKLVVNIGLPSVSEAKLIIPAETGSKPDTVDYLTNSTDSICFSRGPVTLHIVSPNGEVTRDYEVKVNVHNLVSDTLYWNQTAQTVLPTDIAAPTSQGVADVDGTVVCLSTDGTYSSVATTVDPFTGEWQISSVDLPAGAVLSSLTAMDGALYMVDENGGLFTSAGKGESWTATGATMTAILGVNAGKLLGLERQADGSYMHVTYPAGESVAAAADFPVSGFSQAMQYTSEWSDDATTVLMGGITASGDVTGATWGYDGSCWAKLSNTSVPDITGMTMIPYFSFKVDDAWVATKYSVLLAFGGMAADGTMNRTTYISYDQGVNWDAAGDLLNLPEEIPSLIGAQAIVYKQTLTENMPCGLWRMAPQRKLPAGYIIELPQMSSRAVTPITEWECPFIYLFGGYTESGTLNTTLWRGVINRLTFKPIQ